MKVSIESTDSLVREMTVSVPIVEFNNKRNKAIADLKQKVKIDGFRQGRVPESIIEQKYGTNIKTDAANEVVGEVLPKAFDAEKIYPAGQPELIKIDFDNTKEFLFTVKFEVYPEVKIKDLSKLKVEKVTASINKKDEEKTLEGLKEQAATFNVVDRASKKGDQVKIDFEGFLDGTAFEGGKAEDFDLVLGKGQMIPGFEENLIDKKAGDTFNFNVIFPKDYSTQKLAGKETNFKIKMKEVKEIVYPSLDDDFAKKFGKENFDELLSGTREQMQSQLEERLGHINKNNAFEALLEANDLEVPVALIKNEEQNLLQDMKRRMRAQGASEDSNLRADIFTAEATKRVKLGLLVNNLTTENKIEATDDEVDAKLNEMAKQYGENAGQMIDYYKNNKDAIAGIRAMVIEQKVADFIMEKAKAREVIKDFAEVVSGA